MHFPSFGVGWGEEGAPEVRHLAPKAFQMQRADCKHGTLGVPGVGHLAPEAFENAEGSL
jgi:hypothetical protein